MKPEDLKRWTIHIRHYLIFLSREIDIKLCQIYTIHIYAISYKSCNIILIIFIKYATNLKMTISHRSLRISGLLLFFFILIDINDKIISYSPCCPYYVTRTSANGSAVCWSRDTYRRNLSVTLIIINWNIWCSEALKQTSLRVSQKSNLLGWSWWWFNTQTFQGSYLYIYICYTRVYLYKITLETMLYIHHLVDPFLKCFAGFFESKKARV